MKCWFERPSLLETSQEPREWLTFRRNALTDFLTAVALLKKGVRLIQAESKRTQLCLQIELAEEKRNHFTHRSHRGDWWVQQIYVRKKILTLNVTEKFYMQTQAPNGGRRGSSPPCKIFRPPWKKVLGIVENYRT